MCAAFHRQQIQFNNGQQQQHRLKYNISRGKSRPGYKKNVKIVRHFYFSRFISVQMIRFFSRAFGFGVSLRRFVC